MSSTRAHPEHLPSATVFEIEQEHLYRQYLLTTAMEVLYVLRSMQKRGCMATVYFAQGRSFFLTSVLAVGDDGKHFVIDIGSDETVNREALEAARLVVTASLDSVKIQFALSGLQETRHQNRPAFLAAVPPAVLRLQRREYFRLETPLADPLHCQIPLTAEDGSPPTLDLALLDISGGGLSLLVPNEAAHHFQIGKLLANCRLRIPGETAINVSLCVRSCLPVSKKAGHEYLRVGCEFINLPGMWLSAIQRYITRIERERKARLSGLE